MTSTRRMQTTGALLCLSLLGGCIGSLVGGGEPDALYRFGAMNVASAPSPALPQRSLLLMPVRFPAASAGDRLLTVAGNDVAYVKDVRWVSAAPILFREGLAGAFQRRAPHISLAGRMTAGHADAVLTVEVTRFEAVYDGVAAAAPKVHVAGVAILTDPASRAIIARQPFTQVQPASANTTTAIVTAIDIASRDALAGLVDWSNQSLLTRSPRRLSTASDTEPNGTSTVTR